jgi:5'(3')-deoxyribonucleotidase
MRVESTVLFDIDGVLADTAPPVIKEINKLFGLHLRVEAIDSWNYVTHEVKRLTGSAELGEKARQVWYKPDILAKADPIEGAVEAVKYVARVKGWRPWTATARLPNAQEMTIEWVYGNFPEIEKSGGVYMRQPGMETEISEHEIKLLAAGMLAPLIYVEDNHGTVEYVEENIPVKIKPRICMPNRGWNKFAGAKFDRFRVGGLEDILEIARVM